MMNMIKSVLVLDFDNIFGSLFDASQEVAIHFAENPNKLLDGLQTWGLPDGAVRDFIHKGVYMNTTGSVLSGKQLPDGRDERIFFSKFRPHFVRNGFLLVDCPTLTQFGKNAADIQIVVDVLQNLEGRIAYDELIIAAGDSDFAPLLRCVRTNGRLTAIVSAGPTAAAYVNIAHTYLPSDELIDLITGGVPLGMPASHIPRAAHVPPPAKYDEEILGQVLTEIQKRLQQSNEPLLLARLGNDGEFAGLFNGNGTWNGYGTITNFLTAAIKYREQANLSVQHGWIWDNKRHEQPAPVHLPNQPGLEKLGGIVLNAMRIANLPRVSQENWPRVLDAFVWYNACFPYEEFDFTHCTASVRDRLADQGFSIGRGTISDTVYAMANGGVMLNDGTNPDVNRMREAILRNTLNAFERQAITPSDQDRERLRLYLGLTPADPGGV